MLSSSASSPVSTTFLTGAFGKSQESKLKAAGSKFPVMQIAMLSRLLLKDQGHMMIVFGVLIVFRVLC